MGGRQRQSATIHRLRGNPSKLSEAELERREAEEIKPAPIGTTRRPADLSPIERECWDAHAAELERLALLTVLDAQTFRVLVCGPYEVARLAKDLMRPRKADGSIDRRRRGLELVLPDPDHGGARRHPAFVVWKQALAEYRAGCKEFGLTPAARVGLRPAAPIGAVPDDDDDDDSAFFGT